MIGTIQIKCLFQDQSWSSWLSSFCFTKHVHELLWFYLLCIMWPWWGNFSWDLIGDPSTRQSSIFSCHFQSVWPSVKLPTWMISTHIVMIWKQIHNLCWCMDICLGQTSIVPGKGTNDERNRATTTCVRKRRQHVRSRGVANGDPQLKSAPNWSRFVESYDIENTQKSFRQCLYIWMKIMNAITTFQKLYSGENRVKLLYFLPTTPSSIDQSKTVLPRQNFRNSLKKAKFVWRSGI